jgi:hypothetical protein
MKIRMKDAGESPEFGPYQAGDEIGEDRAPRETLQRLIDRGQATENPDPPRRHEGAKKGVAPVLNQE